jgi:hypothetical protein
MPPSTSDVVEKAFSLDTFSRFLHMYDHARSLVRLHGKYTTFSDRMIVVRAQNDSSANEPPSDKELAYSLATAQDAIHTMQPTGPAKDDLQFFKLLWGSAIDAIEKVLEEDLDHEVRAWGRLLPHFWLI